jgi:hypothetical protein
MKFAEMESVQRNVSLLARQMSFARTESVFKTVREIVHLLVPVMRSVSTKNAKENRMLSAETILTALMERSVQMPDVFVLVHAQITTNVPPAKFAKTVNVSPVPTSFVQGSAKSVTLRLALRLVWQKRPVWLSRKGIAKVFVSKIADKTALVTPVRFVSLESVVRTLSTSV